MRSASTPPPSLFALAAAISLCGCVHHGVAEQTIPADAPPRWVGTGPNGAQLLALYEGYDAVGLHEAYADRGWRSRFVDLGGRIDALTPLTEDAWVTANNEAGTLNLARRIGGAWTAERLATLEAAPTQVAAGDLNRDGVPDLAVVSHANRPVLRIFVGTASGTFRTPRIVPLDPRGRAEPTLDMVDLGRNGLDDVVVGLRTGAFSTPVPDHVRVFGSVGHGGLADEWMVRVPAPTQLDAADVDEDGLPDVLAVGPRGAWLLRSVGFGWLDTPQQVARGPFVDGLLDDVNGDGHVDVVLLDEQAARFDVRLGSGAGRLAPSRRYVTGAGPISATTVRRGEEVLLVSANAEDRSFTTVQVRRREPRTSSRRRRR
ncbi:MAG: VCBS repeat-containing protein [Myxococcota bacterium]